MIARARRMISPLMAAMLILAAGYTSWRSYTFQRDLKETTRYYAAWNASQAVTEFERLHEAVIERSPAIPADEIRARFQACMMRVAHLRDGEIGAVVGASPEMTTLVRRLETALQALRPLVGPDADVSQDDIRTAARMMTSETGELVHLAELAKRLGGMRAVLDEQTLFRLHWLFTGLVAALIAAGLWLITQLSRRMRELRIAQHVMRARGAELRTALDAAGAASIAKARFLATISHEIRTPMNAVIGLADSLLDDQLTSAQREMAAMIRDSGVNLLRMVNDILDYSKLDAGRMTFEDKPFSPVSVTETTIFTIGAKAREKGLTIVAIPAPDLPNNLMGDSGRIGQILLNLVSNAVKFTDHGRITVAVDWTARDERTVMIEWTVTDTGIGIEPDQLDKLFDEFVQADQSIASRFGGTGLGLAICKRLVTQMNGTIGVESRRDQGSSFRVRLPFPLAPEIVEAEKPARSNAILFQERVQAMGRVPHVLLAEDNPTNQFVIKRLLSGVDVVLDVVADGRQAVVAADAQRYDVICMDVRMPEMDGLEATRQIRAGRGASVRAPIIALTANAFPEDVQACMDSGMNHFIAKPVRKDVLLGAILSMLPDPAAARGGPAAARDGPASARDEPAAARDEIVTSDAPQPVS